MSSLRNPNPITVDAWNGWLREKLLEGNFKNVEYHESKDGAFSSKRYNMMEYSLVNSRVARVLHDKLKEKGYEHGIFQNKRNAVFKATVDEILSSMTAEEVEQKSERFRTMFD